MDEIRYCTVGAEDWPSLHGMMFDAIVFYDGLLYILDHDNQLWVANLGDANSEMEFCDVPPPPLHVVDVEENVMSTLLVRGDQLIVVFEILTRDQNHELASDFQIFMVNWETLLWELQVIDVNDMSAIFISTCGTGIALMHEQIGYLEGGYVFYTAISQSTDRDLLPLSELCYHRVMRDFLPDELKTILVEDEFNWPSIWLVVP